MPEEVFQVTYICDNCSHSFKERYPKGVEVHQEGRRSFVIKSSTKREISCPNCDSKRIMIAGRQVVK